MADLRCAGCGRNEGDNNELILHGPHAGKKPTDLTIFCAVTGRQERIIDQAAQNYGGDGSAIPTAGQRLTDLFPDGIEASVHGDDVEILTEPKNVR